jgi:Ca-activated chloride channel family protein
VLLVFDVSASMGATDNAPTRLEAAKAAAKALILQRPEEIDIGLVSFSNDVVSQVPPTDDPDVLFTAIDQLVPERNTSLGQGLLAGLQALAAVLPTTPAAPNAAPGVIVVFTDGENKLNPDPLDAGLAAVQLGVRIYPVAYGSLEGTRLQLDGFTVHTQLEPAVLHDLATLTGGAYFNGSVKPNLGSIYRGVATQVVTEATHLEITAWVVGAALLVLLLGAGFSLLWFGRLP